MHIREGRPLVSLCGVRVRIARVHLCHGVEPDGKAIRDMYTLASRDVDDSVTASQFAKLRPPVPVCEECARLLRLANAREAA